MSAPIKNTVLGNQAIASAPPAKQTALSQNEEIINATSLERLPKQSFEQLSQQVQLSTLLDSTKASNLRNAVFSSKLVKELDEENIVFKTALDSTKIPPFGSSHYKSAIRAQKIEQLGRIKQGKGYLEAGCSTLFELFCDSLITQFFDCLNDRNLNMSEKLPTKMEDGSIQVQSRNEIFWSFFGNLFAHIGMIHLVMSLHLNNNWRRPLSIVETRETPLKLQEAFTHLVSNFIQGEELINFNASERGRKFFETILLLKDVVNQEMHNLAVPLKPQPEFSGHFRRLKCRLQMFKNLLNNVMILFPPGLKPASQYQQLFEKDISEYLDLYKALDDALSDISGTSSPSPSQLQKAYQTSYKIITSKNNQHTCLQQISLNLKPAKNQSRDFENFKMLFLFRLLLGFNALEESLKYDLFTVTLRELAQMSDINKEELDTLLVNISKVLQSIIQTSFHSIEETFYKANSCVDLNEKQINQLSILNDVWNAHMSFQRRFSTAIANLLKERSEKCKGSDSIWERVLALRDVLIFVSGNLQQMTDKTNNALMRFKHLFFGLEELDEVIKPIFDELMQLNEFQYEAIQSCVVGIESRIGRCIEQANHEAAEEQTKVESEKRILQQKADDIANELIELEKSARPKAPVKKNVKAPKPIVKPSTPPIQSKTSVPLPPKLSDSPPQIEDVPQSSESIIRIRQSLKSLNGISLLGNGSPFRQKWRDSQLANLDVWLLRIEESNHHNLFHGATIFSETDLMHSLIEAALEIAMSHYPLAASIPQVHQLHLLVQMLVQDIQDKNVVPHNIRNVIWQLRCVPYELSHANRCVNYLHSTYDKMHNFPEQAQKLMHYLKLVEEQASSLKPNPDLSKILLKNHQERLKRTLFFVQKLLEVLVDPSKEMKGEVPSSVTFPEGFEEIQQLSKNNANIQEVDLSNSVEENISSKPIRTREDAINALETIHGWIALRTVSPVEGRINVIGRTKERNLALKNAALYLQRLRGKWLQSTAKSAYDTLSSEWDMIHRTHKELTIAALYHGSYYQGPIHVIEEQDLRFENNPCRLMAILKQFPLQAKKLPHLSPWLGVVHKVLSYPIPLRDEENKHHLARQLRKQLTDMASLSLSYNKLLPGFSLVLPGGEVQTEESFKHKIQSVIENDEREKTYPALAALIQTLRGGMPIRSSPLQSS